jgi:D-mannonate dehydratase
MKNIKNSVDEVLIFLEEKLKDFDPVQYDDKTFEQIATRESNKKSPLLTGRNREVDIKYVKYKVREMFSIDRKKITDTIDYLSQLKF